MISTSSLRYLTIPEVPSLEPLIQAFFDEGEVDGRFSPEHAASVLRHNLKSDTGFVIVSGDPIVAGICGMMYPDMGTGELCCSEWFWYVDRVYRGTSVGLRLLKEFEEEAKRRGAVRVSMMHYVSDKTEKFKHLYEKRGYKMKEQVFSKTIGEDTCQE